MQKKYQNMNDSDEEYREQPEKKSRFLERINHVSKVFNKEGKGVSRDELNVLEKPGIANFFKLLRRKVGTVFSANIAMIVGNFPILFIFIALAYTTRDVLGPDSRLFPILQGTALFDNSPLTMSLLGIFGRQDSISLMSSSTYILLALSALVIFTFGFVNVGVTYILRNVVREEPVFFFSDFIYAIKKNWKQALIFGIIDSLMIIMLVFDVMAYRNNAALSTMYMIMYFLSYAMSVVYFFIRMYAYLMIVTFDMKMTKIIKNSAFFTILGIKRNIMAILVTIIAVILDFFLLNVFMPIGIILPFIFLFGFLKYTEIYCAFPKIKQIMIDPYYNEIAAREESEDEENEEAADC